MTVAKKVAIVRPREDEPTHNPVIQAQYQQLLKRGKEKKIALTACMRKFLTILNAMMRDRQPFQA